MPEGKTEVRKETSKTKCTKHCPYNGKISRCSFNAPADCKYARAHSK